jgi:hypothetical protein
MKTIPLLTHHHQIVPDIYTELKMSKFPRERKKIVLGFATATDQFGERGAKYNMRMMENLAIRYAKLCSRFLNFVIMLEIIYTA